MGLHLGGGGGGAFLFENGGGGGGKSSYLRGKIPVFPPLPHLYQTLALDCHQLNMTVITILLIFKASKTNYCSI